jgi:CubicO group peptidase (beta-lactamase class C family)
MSEQAQPERARPEQERELPGQPNLRYLKLEARRRLAEGEFATLHDSQLAIAREYGQSSWTTLKELITSRLAELGHPALEQVRWLISRFGAADSPGWAAPADDELREHFDEGYLGRLGWDRMEKAVGTLTRVSARLRGQLVITQDDPLHARARTGGIQFEADVQPEPPHKLVSLRVYAVGSEVTDARVAKPPTSRSGNVPMIAAETAAVGFGELGLPGVVLAGASATQGNTAHGGTANSGTAPDADGWVVARGWADLDRPTPLRPDHRFPVYGITRLVTATAVLRLVADGRVRLDDAANAHLRTVRLADDAVTVRELLSYTGGVDGPGIPYVDTVPSLTSLYGPVMACSGPRGTARIATHGGYAALGQLIADVTGTDYADAATRLVLGPLGMTGSRFPVSWPYDDPDAVTGYELEPDGTYVPDLDEVAAVPAAAGLWTTAPDLIRFGAGWSSLLPAELASEAIRPQASAPAGPGQCGFGWSLNAARGFASETGNGPGGSASLMVRLSDGRPYVALTNRKISISPLNIRVLVRTA